MRLCRVVGLGLGGWGGAGWRAAGRAGVDLRNPAHPGPHARGTAGWGAHCRSASSFFSSSSICRGRSRAVRHALLGSGRALATGRQQGGTGRWAARRDRCGVPRVRAAETRRVACAGESGWRAGHCCGECRSIARHTEHVGGERDREREWERSGRRVGFAHPIECGGAGHAGLAARHAGTGHPCRP